MDPLLLESNDFTPSTRSSTSESISDSSPLITREAQSDIAADIKVILAGQDKVMILQLVVSATTSGFNKKNLGEEDLMGRERETIHIVLRSQISYCILYVEICERSGTSYHYHEPLL